MAVWSTRQDHRDPAALIHAIVHDGHGRTLGPVCGATSDGLWLALEAHWETFESQARCALCDRQLARAGVLEAPAP